MKCDLLFSGLLNEDPSLEIDRVNPKEAFVR